MSQLLSRLQEQLKSELNPDKRAELSAHIACNLARLGKFDQAQGVVADARAASLGGGLGTVWIMLAEGLIHYFENLGSSALDRISRAQLLGLSLKFNRLVALTSAWKAHIEFEESKFDAMAASIRLTLDSVSVGDADANTRLAMVLANGFSFCGDWVAAQRWFRFGHDQAVRNGDSASIDALVYNKAALLVSHLRLKRCSGPIELAEMRRVRMEVASSSNLSALTRIDALGSYLELIDARLLVLEGKYDLARLRLSGIQNKSSLASYNSGSAYMALELCFCDFSVGDKSRVDAYLQTNPIHDFGAMEVDEQIFATWMLASMAEGDSRFGAVEDYRATLTTLTQRHTSIQSAVAASLLSMQFDIDKWTTKIAGATGASQSAN